MSRHASHLRYLSFLVAGGAAVATAAFGVQNAVATTASPASALVTHGSAERGSVSRTAGPLFARHRTVDPNMVRTRSTKTNNEQSENWSGYIASGSSGAYSSSSASWTVPTLSTQYNGYSSTWVGIDGASSSDGYLIQTGTEADVVNGQTQYDAWWEVITPSDEAPETLFSNLSISPGDSITASVAKGSDGDWTMTLTDNSTGQSGSQTSSFAGPGETAEWIQEDTDVNGDISSAPDWGSVSFSGITTNGADGGLSGAQAVDIYDSQGTQEDSTGAANGSDDGFTVTWLAPGTETPTS